MQSAMSAKHRGVQSTGNVLCIFSVEGMYGLLLAGWIICFYMGWVDIAYSFWNLKTFEGKNSYLNVIIGIGVGKLMCIMMRF